MLVTSLILVTAFAASSGDIHQSHHDTIEKQAYYAALAGVQEYEYQLQNNPDYWQTCTTPSNTVPQEPSERYEITLLVASSAPKETTACDTTKPFESMIESKAPLANTFRIESTGCAGVSGLTSSRVNQPQANVASRSIVATFKVSGFLDYVFFTQYELVDPTLYSHSAKCEEYYEGGKRSGECATLVFAKNDSVFGPMHTDDAAHVTCSSEVVFGREKQVPPDVVEINGGTWPSCGGSGPTFNTATKSYIKGPTLEAPESDSSLGFYVEHEPQQNEFIGRTELILNGTTNEITVKNYKEEPPTGSGKLTAVEKKIKWPANGLIYVTGNNNVPCVYKYKNDSSYASDNAKEWEEEKGCANVYVQGTYSKSLTIGAENELIINGDTYPTSVAGSLGSAPTGTTTLGLIATRMVRVYHPCTNSGNQPGYMESPWIYAAILSTSHSFTVDNYECGAQMKNLNVYGAIGQKFRGPVGTVGNSGYIKNYKYDGRLATDEPPYFLAPLKAGWKVARETAPAHG